MKKRTWKALAVLAAGAAAAAGGAYVYAKKNPEQVKQKAEVLGDKAIAGLFKGMTNVLPTMPATPIEQYQDENFLPGQELFAAEPKKGAKWSLGYARRSLIPEGFTGKGCYIGGFLAMPPNEATGVLDDQAVRVICVDDGSGRGAAVFAVVDCIGLSAPEIREIREDLRAFAAEHNIKAINISATHCHSAVDTQGLWGDLPNIMKTNIKALREKRYDAVISGKNKEFMANLRLQVADAIREAALGMQPGRLFYTNTDEFDHNYDKREPDVRVRDIGKLRFAPDDGSAETVVAFMAAHPVSVGYRNTLVSADYIYFIEESVNKEGANFLFFQGPQLAVATQRGQLPEDLEGEGYQRYGRYVGSFLMGLSKEIETELEPILNFRLKEFLLPCDNQVFNALSQLGIVSNKCITDGDVHCFATEVGYVELGSYLRVGMVPCELAPEILLGGAFTAQESYTKTSWDFPPLRDLLPADCDFKIIGLCNDSVGYILPDNDYGSILASGHYEESVSAGRRAGSTMTRAFMDLVHEAGRMPVDA